jgi:chemotaxis methyl-accepting protein methylase
VIAELYSSLLPHLEEDDYVKFNALAQALTGMNLGAHRRPELARAIGETSQATGVTNLSALYDLLRRAPVNDPARATFVRHLSVGETHFFRNEPQFMALTRHILPDLIERKRHLRHLRIWSAGCSTGEEPYSLAILLEQLLPDLADWSVLLLATDINQDALARAKQGVYGAWSFRQTPPSFQANYFTQEGRTFHPAPAHSPARHLCLSQPGRRRVPLSAHKHDPHGPDPLSQCADLLFPDNHAPGRESPARCAQ